MSTQLPDTATGLLGYLCHRCNQYSTINAGGLCRGCYVADATIAALRKQIEALTRERDEELALLNTPETEEFDKAIPLEAAHQVQCWGAQHDAGKAPYDWFWLIGYLAGKALHSATTGNVEKVKHHCISTAAALRNWHAHLRSRESVMRPGISGEKQAVIDAAYTEGGESKATSAENKL